MPIIDDEGRLFGIVNVIDALVVLLVLAVVVAGVALVMDSGGQGPSPDRETRYATIDFGTAPAYIAETVSEGDQMNVNDAELTITDLVVQEAGEDSRRVVARVQINGTVKGDAVQYDGGPLRLGRTLTVSTPRYQVKGSIVNVASERSSLMMERKTTFVTLNFGPQEEYVAENIENGVELDTDRGALQITDIYAAPADQNRQHLVARAKLNRTVLHDPGVEIGQPLRAGQSLSLENEGVEISGTITRSGDLGRSLPTRDVSVRLETTVSESVATRMETGGANYVGDHPQTTIESIHAYPVGKDRVHVSLGAELEALDTRSGPRVANQRIEEGSQVPLLVDGSRLTPTVSDVGSTSRPGTETTATVTVHLDNVQPWVAANLRSGMTETAHGDELARITSVRTSPATMTVTDESGTVQVVDHPERKDVELTVAVQGRETAYGTLFHGQKLVVNDVISLDFGTIRVSGRVKAIQ